MKLPAPACPGEFRLQFSIEVEHLRAALAIWDYCDHSAMILFSEENNPSPLEKKVLDFIRANPNCSKTDISRQAVSHSVKANTLNAAIDSLCSRRLIARLKDDRSERFRVYVGGAGNSGIADSVGTLFPKLLSPIRKLGDTSIPESLNPQADSGVGSECQNPQSPMQSLVDLIDWKNANGVSFIKHGDGNIWVSQRDESLLTAEVRAAIKSNQETLSLLAQPEDDIDAFIESLRQSI